MDAVVISNVNYSYPRAALYALNRVSFSVKKGEFLAVMGANGAGKTAFCKLINGVIPHLSGGKLTGAVTVDGINTNDASVPSLALKVGLVLDDPDAQLFTSTVRGEVAFGPENILLPPEEITERIEFSLSAVGLNGFEDRAPSTLSGGEKQRLCIAASLAMKPDILVLDEPLCRLDPDGAMQVMNVLADLKNKHGITIIMASHDSAKMKEFADRVCIFKNGKIAALGKADDIFADNELLEQNGIQPINKKLVRSPGLSGARLMNPIINIKDFSYKYSDNICIKNINLAVYENDFIALTGSNGCGKTTLLKNITGLLRPAGGDIFIKSKNIKELKVCDISKEIGFVMQNPDSQLFSDTVYKEAAFALKNMRLPKKEIKKRVHEALETVGLTDKIDAFPHALSRADRVKTVIACVLAMGCKILIFDEVDAGNDYNGNVKVMNIARDLHSEGFTIIFVTHNMSLAYGYAHRIIKMERNGIISNEEGTE
jgi:energy-coupling factor transport system ATP-binding protein